MNPCLNVTTFNIRFILTLILKLHFLLSFCLRLYSSKSLLESVQNSCHFDPFPLQFESTMLTHPYDRVRKWMRNWVKHQLSYLQCDTSWKAKNESNRLCDCSDHSLHYMISHTHIHITLTKQQTQPQNKDNKFSKVLPIQSAFHLLQPPDVFMDHWHYDGRFSKMH